jgi:hypothetical protein
MKKEENPNIEELLNSYIDGELTERHRIEVQRLVSHDAEVARRLRELQKCKMLVSSLPRAEAPAELFSQIKASLESRTFLEQQPSGFERREGARHLLARKVLAAAAMIGLVAILGAVIYTIVVPESTPPVLAFNGRLELKTNNLTTVEAVINKAMEDKGLADCISRRRQAGKTVYSVRCRREVVNLLLADLGEVWDEFDSARLTVETATAGERVLDSVTPAGIVDLMTPPKPRLTSKEQEPEKRPILAKDEEKVSLTIVVGGKQ